MPADERAPFYRDVQGLRGVAVLLVVLYHSVGAPFTGGYVGVDVFFVISGFLITRLLVREYSATGSIRLVEFYARRARRLLPAASLVIVTTIGVVSRLGAPAEAEAFATSALAATFYVSNVVFAARSADYLAGDLDQDPLLHTWSLGVEEQFYFVWPLLVAVAALAGRRLGGLARGAGVVFVAVAFASLAVCLVQTWQARPWAFFGMPARAWEFGLGALAWLWFGHGVRSRIAGEALGWAGGGAILLAVAFFTSDMLFPGWLAGVPAVGAACLIVAGRSAGPTTMTGILSMRPLQWLGDISYSWYLWHWPALVFARQVGGWGVAVTLVAIAGSLLAADLTHRFIENPVRRHSALARRPWLSVAGALILAIATGTTAGTALAASRADMARPGQLAYARARADDPVVYRDGCHADHAAVLLRSCAYGRADADRTILLFGDSHAAHWFPALELIALETGSRLESFTKSACPSAVLTVRNDLLARTYTECDAWRERVLDHIVRTRPDLVVLSNQAGYRPAMDDASGTPADEWSSAMGAVLRRLGAAGIPVLVLHDVPRPTEVVPDCLARAALRGSGSGACSFSTSEGRHWAFATAEASAVETSRTGLFLDLTSAICPLPMCAVERDGMVLYRDDSHLTATFSRSLAPDILAALRRHAATGEWPSLSALLGGAGTRADARSAGPRDDPSRFRTGRDTGAS